MTGNGVNGDLSYCYIQSPNSLVEHNQFFNSVNALHNCGGIEMHATNYTARGNVLRNLWPAMYLGDGTGTFVSDGALIEGNYFGFNAGALSIIDRHAGLRIYANYFEANADSTYGTSFVDIYTPFNGITGVVGSGTQTGLKIHDNYFDCSLLRTGALRSLVAGSVSINLGALLGLNITNNVFYAPQVAVEIEGNITSENKDVLIFNNELLEVVDITGSGGSYFAFAADAAIGWGTGAVFENCFVENNKIFRNSGLSQTSLWFNRHRKRIYTDLQKLRLPQ